MNKPLRLDGKVCVVTGAGGGIGREIALHMARHGACVVVNDVGVSLDGARADTSVAQSVVDEIVAEGGRAASSADSVADAGSANRIVEAALDHFGRIDGVVNNAGILRDRYFHKMNPDDWDSVLQVHLYGTYHVSRAAAPHLKAQESGSLVHMTSTSGLIGNFGQANYSAAKLGIVALSKSIALDMRKFDVRSNSSRGALAATGQTHEPQAVGRLQAQAQGCTGQRLCGRLHRSITRLHRSRPQTGRGEKTLKGMTLRPPHHVFIPHELIRHEHMTHEFMRR